MKVSIRMFGSSQSRFVLIHATALVTVGGDALLHAAAQEPGILASREASETSTRFSASGLKTEEERAWRIVKEVL